MLGWVRSVCLGLLAVGLLTVAFANRSPVAVRLLPEEAVQVLGFGGPVELPLFLVIFGGIVAGVLIGFVWEWLREAHVRAEARRKGREVTRLEQEVTRLQDQKSRPGDDILALLRDTAPRR